MAHFTRSSRPIVERVAHARMHSTPQVLIAFKTPYRIQNTCLQHEKQTACDTVVIWAHKVELSH